MAAQTILYPVFALVALTFAVGFRMGGLRIAAMRRKEVNPRYFKLNAGAEIPVKVAQAANNYANLFELPLLFYTLVALLLATGRVDALQLGLAWAFVASRAAHSLIHLGSNNVPRRFFCFAAGLLILIAMWVVFAAEVIAR